MEAKVKYEVAMRAVQRALRATGKNKQLDPLELMLLRGRLFEEALRLLEEKAQQGAEG